jgi:hypothetical protein
MAHLKSAMVHSLKEYFDPTDEERADEAGLLDDDEHLELLNYPQSWKNIKLEDIIAYEQPISANTNEIGLLVRTMPTMNPSPWGT